MSKPARSVVWDVLQQSEGNREVAAAILGRSRRTLDRWIRQLDLYPEIDKSGMLGHAGPPRISSPRGREKLIHYIKANNGDVSDYESMAAAVFDDMSLTHAVRKMLLDLDYHGYIVIEGTKARVLK